MSQESFDFELNPKNLAARVASAESDHATPQAVAETNAEKKSVNAELTHFMLIPKDDSGNPMMKGEETLLEHMCTFHNIQHDASAKGKGTDEDKTTLMCSSTNLCVHLSRFAEKHTANSKSAIKDYV